MYLASHFMHLFRPACVLATDQLLADMVACFVSMPALVPGVADLRSQCACFFRFLLFQAYSEQVLASAIM